MVESVSLESWGFWGEEDPGFGELDLEERWLFELSIIHYTAASKTENIFVSFTRLLEQ